MCEPVNLLQGVTSSEYKNAHELLKKIKKISYDFDGLFTDYYVYLVSNGAESLKCSRVDGSGLSGLGKLGFHKV